MPKRPDEQTSPYPTPEDRFVREPERASITGISRRHWYRLEEAGDAPKRRKLSPTGTACGWLLSELRQWQISRPVAPSSEAA